MRELGASTRDEGDARGKLFGGHGVVFHRRGEPGELAAEAEEVEMLEAVVADARGQNRRLPVVGRKRESGEFFDDRADAVWTGFEFSRAEMIPGQAECGKF